MFPVAPDKRHEVLRECESLAAGALALDETLYVGAAIKCLFVML